MMLPRSQVPVEDTRFEAVLAGPADAPLVVALHGFPQTADAWDQLVPPLVSAGFRVVAPDQRGYSPATVAADDRAYQVTRLARDVLGIATALGAERFHVVGHDWGGFVAWWLAAVHAERVQSLVVVSTPHPRALAGALRGFHQRGRSAYMPVFRSPWGRPLLGGAGALGLRAILGGTGLPRRHRRVYIRAMRRPGVLHAALGWYRANRIREMLGAGTVTVPTTVVWGRRDPAVGPGAIAGTAAHVRAPYHLVRLRAGHWLPETRPEALADAVLAHLTSAVPPPGDGPGSAT